MNFKIWGTIIIITFLALVSGFKNTIKSKTSGGFEPVAVIELFTSQGCSSCPPADALLSQTIATAKKEGKKIFALSFHVDYWNRLGWVDPFSDKKYSERQMNYSAALNLNGVYTPQVVINGSTQFTGSDKSLLTQSLARGLNIKAAVSFKTFTATYEAGNQVMVQYELEGDFATSKIYFALVSLAETTFVKRGENGGHTLKNDNVVRQLISKTANAAGKIEFPKTLSSTKENTTIIGFVQEEKSFKIIGAAMAKLN